MPTNPRRTLPWYNCLGLVIFAPASPAYSRHCAHHPTTLAIVNMTVYISSGIPSAHRTIPGERARSVSERVRAGSAERTSRSRSIFTAVEVDVGVERSTHEVVILPRRLLQFHRNRQQRVFIIQPGEHLGGHLSHNLRARIVILVHPMPESHQAERIRLILGSLQNDWNRIHPPKLLDLQQHLHDSNVGPPMRGPVQ